MKNLKLLFASVFFLFLLDVSASQLVVHVKAYKEAKNQNYVLCISQYDMSFTYGHEYNDIYFSENGIFNIELDAGGYNFCVLYPYSAPFYYNIYLKDKNDRVEFNVELDKYCIPEKIENVKMFGNFNDYDNVSAINLKYNTKKKYWYLPKNEFPSNIELFKFYINDYKIAYLLNYPIDTVNKWASPINVLNKKDNEIVFDPSSFKRGEPKPKVTGTFDTTYHYIFEKLQNNFLEAISKARQIINENELKEFKNNVSKYFDFLNAQKTLFGKTYPWLFTELEYQMNDIAFESEMSLARSKNSSIEMQKIYKSSTYTEKIRNQARVLYNAEISELLLNERIINAYWQMDYDVESRGILLEEKFQYGYFKRILYDMLEKSNNNQICGKILDMYTNQVSYSSPELAEKYLLKVANNYPLYEGNKNGNIAGRLAGLTVKEGAKAPLFSVKTIYGKNISLTDYKGKYVFIDFWGTWCAPCRSEIPNVIALSKSFPDSVLVVIGLARDIEKEVKLYVEKNQIPYDNAIADEGLLKKYGINAYPTTLLIDPEGMIVQRNLRGGELVEMVKSQMKK
jgi:thiol-disulfide isomerase/thioredoxin